MTRSSFCSAQKGAPDDRSHHRRPALGPDRRPPARGLGMTAATMTVIELLEDLVRIDSVNPGLDPSGAGEAQIAAYVAAWGQAAGLRVDILEGTPGRPSVVLRGGDHAGGRRLLLCGHLDTVGLA